MPAMRRAIENDDVARFRPTERKRRNELPPEVARVVVRQWITKHLCTLRYRCFFRQFVNRDDLTLVNRRAEPPQPRNFFDASRRAVFEVVSQLFTSEMHRAESGCSGGAEFLPTAFNHLIASAARCMRFARSAALLGAGVNSQARVMATIVSATNRAENAQASSVGWEIC